MALSAKLEMRQGQQLVMTPQLQQAIRLLQLSNLELNEFVDAELERNPLLEREEQSAAPKTIDDAPESTSDGSGDRADDDWLDLRKPVEDHAGSLDTDFGNVFQSGGTGEPGESGPQSGMSWSNVTQRMHNGDDDGDLDSIAAGDVSLRTHLSEQIPLTLQTPAERLIGQYLVDLIDEAGYIPPNLESLSERLGAPLSMIEGVLTKLQTLDPPGIFARSLGECLALQQSLRSIDGAFARQSRFARRPQFERLEKGRGRGHGRPGRYDSGDQAAQSEARLEVRRGANAAGRA